MMLAGEARAGESDEIGLHAGRSGFGNFQQSSRRGALGQWRRVFVRGDHGGQRIIAPGGNQQIGTGTDHPRHAHHQRPGQCHYADQVVQVQPTRTPGFIDPHLAELQLAHERRIQHGPGNDRHHKQQTHERQQQFAGQVGVHVYVQAQHDHHEAAIGRRHFQRFTGACIKGEGVRGIGLGACGCRGDGHHAIGVFVVPAEILHHLAGAMCFGGPGQLLQVQMRRVGRHLLVLRGVAQQVIDFMMEDQRQSCNREHQQKQGANQAAPGMHDGPAAHGLAFHGLSTGEGTQNGACPRNDL
ncbi:Unknown protein sequence [Pseudomonas syringae pv. maculicola]|nr:Unknown protein sequence [Pseudomonas syringae pv. maculicola]